MIKFIEYSLKSSYTALTPKDVDAFYFIKETQELFLGENQYGVSVEFVETALPASGIKNKLYIVKSGTNKGVYFWNGTSFSDLAVISGFVTIDGVQTVTNKTIDASNNTITNIDMGNFKSSLLDKDLITGTKTDETLPTSKAVFEYLSAVTGSVFDLRGSVNIASPGTTFNNAKKGHTWIIQGSAVYQGEDFNTNDLIVFIKNISTTVQAGDFVKIDNSESPDIIRKIVGAGADTVTIFTSDGNIQSSGKTISTAAISSSSTDNTIPTSKSVHTAVDKKAAKPTTSTNGNIPKLDASGNLLDAGIAATSIVTLTDTQTLTNKTINAANNSILNLTVNNFASGTIKTSIETTASDNEMLTAKAVYDALKVTRL